MQNAGTIRTNQKHKPQNWFGVWGVNNYYHKLELQALAGAEFNLGYFLLIIASSLLATGGLLANNAAVIIGAMCVAPFLGPSRAVCLGGLYLDKKIFWRGLIKQLIGLFIVGAGFAYIITAVLINTTPGIDITHEILLRAMPTEKDVILTLIIAIAAGAGASLAFTADPHVVDQPWGQLLDVMIGVEIAISLLPPASVIGIGFAFGNMSIVLNAAGLLCINILALDILGSMFIFLLRGIRKRYFGLERTMRQISESALLDISETVHDSGIVDVILLSEERARLQITLRACTNDVPADYAQRISQRILREAKCTNEVSVEILPCQLFSCGIHDGGQESRLS
jgi:uncharacterized hydrophobic protein (TIGR00271 family)